MCGAVFVELNQAIMVFKPEELTGAARIIRSALVDSKIAHRRKTDTTFHADPVMIVPDPFNTVAEGGASRTEIDALIIADVSDEVHALLQFCNVINCSNVELRVRPPVKLAQARTKAGKVPFYTYKILGISDEQVPSHIAKDGTHTGPRQHLRRGHIRRLNEQQRAIWVRPHIVNPGSEAGIVVKDYSVTSTRNKIAGG